ncbi:MAG: hypothetical protein QXI19_03560 [Candidatus Caldarchaeum sp.]
MTVYRSVCLCLASRSPEAYWYESPEEYHAAYAAWEKDWAERNAEHHALCHMIAIESPLFEGGCQYGQDNTCPWVKE